VSRSERLRD